MKSTTSVVGCTLPESVVCKQAGADDQVCNVHRQSTYYLGDGSPGDIYERTDSAVYVLPWADFCCMGTGEIWDYHMRSLCIQPCDRAVKSMALSFEMFDV
jgi:hypothetical protein